MSVLILFLTVAWTIEIVATEKITYSPTIALDSSDNPNILFSKYRGSAGAHALYYLFLYAKVNGNWTADTFEMNCSEPTYPPDLAVDIRNRIWCIYRVIDTTTYVSYLIVANKDSIGWIKDTVESSVSLDFLSYSITTDSLDIPHIAYDAEGGQNACYAILIDSIWTKTVFDTLSAGWSSHGFDINVDSRNYPYISYIRNNIGGSGELWYAKKVDSMWAKERVDSFFFDDLPTSIAIGPDSFPEIVYTETHLLGENPIVKYAYYNGTFWYIDTVETLSGCNNQNAFDIDSLGKPYLVYCHQGGSRSEDKIAYKDTLGWYREILPFTPATTWGWGGSLRIGEDNLIHIARYATDSTDSIHEIHYIYGTPIGIEEKDTKFIVFTGNLGLQIYPNPIHKNCNIRYTLLQNTRVNILMYDVTGRLVKEIINENQNIGIYNKIFDMTNLPQGIYFIRLNTENHSDIKKIIFIK